MRITLTDATTHENLGTRNVSAAAKAIYDAETNITVHEGYYPKAKWTYDGTNWTEIASPVQPGFENQSPSQMTLKLRHDLLRAGMALENHQYEVLTKDQAKELIDQAAGRARMRLVSKGLLIDQEYLLAELDVKKWRADGEPTTLPPSLQTWVDASGMTVSDAAANIEQTATAFRNALSAIRDKRLKGKAAVDTATDFKATAQTYIDDLDAL